MTRPRRQPVPVAALLLTLLLMLLPTLGCRKESAAPAKPRRLAILPVENLTSDISLDWVTAAATRALALELAGVRGLETLMAPAERDAAASGAAHVLRGRFSRHGARLQIDAEIQDTSTLKTIQHISVVGDAEPAGGAPGAALIPLLDRVAREMNPAASPCPTRSAAALRAFAESALAGSPRDAAALLEKAVSADSGFGAAWVARIEALRAAGDRDAALQAAEASKTAQLTQADRARIDYLAAVIGGDESRRDAALAELGKATPGDPAVLRAMAASQYRQRHFTEAAASFERLLALEPNSGPTLNQLAYAQAWAGNLEASRKTLERYAQLEPANPNSLDSLGEVHLLRGRFAEAERYFLQAGAKDRNFLQGATFYKAALARMLAGDTAAADAGFARYLEVRRDLHDPMLAVHEARWKRMTGRRDAALAILAAQPSDAGALTELALWNVEQGRRDQARDLAARALAAAGAQPQLKAWAYIAAFLAQPQADAAEWRARADKAIPGAAGAGLRAVALGLALLFSHQWRDAAAEWSTLVSNQDPAAAGEYEVLAAWAESESGQLAQAGKRLGNWPIPPPGGDTLTTVLVYPRIFDLRARTKVGDAAREVELFRKYGGAAAAAAP